MSTVKNYRPAAASIEIPDEVLVLLAAADRPVEDVLIVIDEQTHLDEVAVDELRAQVEAAQDESFISDAADTDDLAAGALEDESDDDSEDEVDDRELGDFDLEALVSGLDTTDIDACLNQFEAIRPAYTRAARRAKKKNPSADFFAAMNVPLFGRRIALQAQLAEVDSVEEMSRAEARRVGRLRRQLEAMTELIVRFNWGMTRKYVRVFTSNTSKDSSDDFQGAAIVGLMAAIDTFDPSKGKFGSWAYKRIQGEVLRAVHAADFKSMNYGDFDRRPAILEAQRRLAGPNDERTPSFEEIAAEVGCTVGLVKRVLAAPKLESLHVMVGHDGKTELGSLIPDDDQAVDDQVIGAMDVSALTEFGLSVLDTREHFVLARRYGLDGEPVQCLSSIGKQLCLSREAVRQIESKAMARLLHPVTLARIVRHGR